jgi:D-sedoheptulose 7-phosphate isomerase
MTAATQLAQTASRRLLERNAAYRRFFDREADRLANACRSMAERFRAGGRLLAFGRGACATDAQHVSVEFIHPVIVGKRALPALDISGMLDVGSETLMRPEDIAMGFGPPAGDHSVASVLNAAKRIGAMTFALPGGDGDYFVEAFSADAFQQQEVFEILYHTLWETVHVFLEREELAAEAGSAGFLYPFLGGSGDMASDPRPEVAQSIRMKAADDVVLRERVATEEVERVCEASLAIAGRVARGGRLLLFGNGGSATDANDWALDCICPPNGMRPIPALSLSSEPAVLTAIANDIGMEAVFLRQLIAHARPHDVVIGISTSGGSRNLLACFEEARRRKLFAIALLGYDGGEVVRRGLADVAIVVRSDYIPRIQEVQASVYHVIRQSVEDVLRD